jgi:hypothetical protein
MCPALVTRGIVLARAAVLGGLLDRRANGRVARGSLHRREGSGPCRHGRKGYEAGKDGSDDANVSLRRAPPEAVWITTANTALNAQECPRPPEPVGYEALRMAIGGELLAPASLQQSIRETVRRAAAAGGIGLSNAVPPGPCRRRLPVDLLSPWG